MSALLAGQSLLAARTSTAVSVLLVSTSVLFVVGAERAFTRLAEVVSRLADGGTGVGASIGVDRCPHCAYAFRASPLLQRLVGVQSGTTVTLRRVGVRSTPAHVVQVVCVPPWSVPSGVQWAQPLSRRSWASAVGAAGVLVGASLGDSLGTTHGTTLGTTLGTTEGEWHVLGQLPTRPLLSHDAAMNGAIVVPWRTPFRRLCDRGKTQWRAEAADSATLHHRLAQIDAELRTVHQLRPAQTPPWRMDTPDRFGALVQALVRRFALWVLAVPITVSLLCGAGIFSVQTLEGSARVHEFGVRRAVGATRTDLLGQLLAESVLVGAAGIALAAVVLAVGGLLGETAYGITQGFLTAVMVAVPLCGVGLLVPGLSAVRVSSIAALEGGGTT